MKVEIGRTRCIMLNVERCGSSHDQRKRWKPKLNVFSRLSGGKLHGLNMGKAEKNDRCMQLTPAAAPPTQAEQWRQIYEYISLNPQGRSILWLL